VECSAHWLEGGEAERIDQIPTELGSIEQTVTVMTSHPSSDLLFLGTATGEILVFDPSLRQIVKSLKAHTNDVTQIVFAPGQNRFLTASVDGFVQWWSASTLQREQGFSAGTPIFAVAASPKGRYVAAGGHDKSVRIWDAQTGELAHTLKGHTDHVTAIDWLSEKLLLSAGASGIVRGWEVDLRRCYRTDRVHEEHISRLMVLQGGESYLTASWDGRIKIWTPKHRLKFELPTGPAAVISISLLPDGNRLAAGYWNGTVVIWDLSTGKVFDEFIAHEGNLASSAVTLGGQLAITINQEGSLRSWSLATMGVSRFANLHTGEVYGLAYSPDNMQAISVGHDGQIKLWGRNEHTELASLDPQIGPIMSCAISPDKRLWALGLSSGEIRIWNAEQQTFESSLMGHKDGISSIAFSPNGNQILSASWDMKLKLWSLEKLRVLTTMHGHSKEIASMDISLDGRLAISACWDMTARLWDLSQTSRDYLSDMRTLSGHQGRVLACAFHPNGTSVATASADETIRLWLVDKAIDPKVLHGHSDAVTAIRYTPSGQLLLSAGRDGQVLIWDADEGTVVARLEHESPILSLALSPDGTQAMIGDEAGRVRFVGLNYRVAPNWVAAETFVKEPPLWLRGKRPTELYEIECIYCGYNESLKRAQLGNLWRCKGCGDSLMICPKPMFPLAAETVD